jgi:putative nucleotidyltransferase with HDIG domain
MTLLETETDRRTMLQSPTLAPPARQAGETSRAVLLIDDEDGIRDSLSMYLRGRGLVVVEAATGDEALRLLKQRSFGIVITDISMPGQQSGLEVLEHIKAKYPSTEVIMMTGHVDVDFAITSLKHGAFDYFKKPFLFEEVYLSLERALERRRLLEKARELERMRQRQETMAQLHTQFMISLAAMIDAKSRYTRLHSERVSGYARFLAEELGVSPVDRRKIVIGGKLHDIGKIGTPEEILNKPGKLTPEEWRIIQEHPACGADLLKPISFMEPYLPIVRSHHENWDGTGYPDGLKGDQIPEAVMIVKIADYYDAITSDRPYREPMSLREAIDTLEGEIGKAFPEDVVRAFVKVLERAPWRKEPAAPRAR